MKNSVKLSPFAHTFGQYLNLITGLIEAFIFYGFAMSFYFITLILVQNGHFCDKAKFDILWSDNPELFQNLMYKNESYMNSKYYQNCVSDQQDTIASIMATVPVAILALPGFFFGMLVDKFRVLFVRIIIITLMLLGLLLLSLVTLQHEFYLYISVVLISIAVALLMIEATRDVPNAVPEWESIVKSLCMGLQMGTGFFYSLINKYLIGRQVRFEDPNYFWNLQNFSYVMMGLTLVITGGPELIAPLLEK